MTLFLALTVKEILSKLTAGFGYTIEIFALTLVMSLPLGLLVCLGSMSKFKPLSWLVKGFIWIIRGTPLMLQIIVVFYGPGLLFDYPMKSRIIATVIAFVINYACYFSEIYRGGIMSVPRGQAEAGAVLGLKRSTVFFKVTLPQVAKKIVPPLGNEIITLVKDTSLANIIAVNEIIRVTKTLVSVNGVLTPFIYTAVYYLLFIGIITILLNITEKHFGYYED